MEVGWWGGGDGGVGVLRWSFTTAACCLLPAVCCLLPPVCCLLPPASCRPTAHYMPADSLLLGKVLDLTLRVVSTAPKVCPYPQAPTPGPGPHLPQDLAPGPHPLPSPLHVSLRHGGCADRALQSSALPKVAQRGLVRETTFPSRRERVLGDALALEERHVRRQ